MVIMIRDDFLPLLHIISILSAIQKDPALPKDNTIAPIHQTPTGVTCVTCRCHYTRVPTQLVPPGVSGAALTSLNLDKSSLLEVLVSDGYGGRQQELLGELQWAFIAFLCGQSLEGKGRAVGERGQGDERRRAFGFRARARGGRGGGGGGIRGGAKERGVKRGWQGLWKERLSMIEDGVQCNRAGWGSEGWRGKGDSTGRQLCHTCPMLVLP